MNKTEASDLAEKYPEHIKLHAVAERSQAIGAFIDESPYILAEYQEVDGFKDPILVSTSKSITQVLADYFEIDLDKIEAEKRAMLEAIRAEQKEF